jgi:precorrin-6B methylase 1
MTVLVVLFLGDPFGNLHLRLAKLVFHALVPGPDSVQIAGARTQTPITKSQPTLSLK